MRVCAQCGQAFGTPLAARAHSAECRPDPMELVLQAEVELRQDRPARALEQTTGALRIAPRLGRAWLRRSQALRRLGRWADGLAAVEEGERCGESQAIRLERQAVEEGLAAVLEAVSGLLSGGGSCLAQMAEIDPTNLTARVQLAAADQQRAASRVALEDTKRELLDCRELDRADRAGQALGPLERRQLNIPLGTGPSRAALGALLHRALAECHAGLGEKEAGAEAMAAACRLKPADRDLWQRSLELAGQLDGQQAEQVLREAVELGVWPSAMQRPTQFVPGLTARAWHDCAQQPVAQALEAGYSAVKQELLTLLGRSDAFGVYDSVAVTSGEWSDVTFILNGKVDGPNCARCPLTAGLLLQPAVREAATSCVLGSAYLSKLAPGTHLAAHCGPTNARLRCHLGLIVPAGCSIRVGRECRTWREGECILFDDSFEHEVVLIVDIWHPGLIGREARAAAIQDPHLKARYEAICRSDRLLG